MHPNAIQIRAAAVTKFLYALTAVLTAVHITVLVIYYWVDDEEKFDFIRLVDMDYEGNLPTLFSVLLFFLAAGLFWLLGRWQKFLSARTSIHPGDQFGWFGLSAIFVFLGADEGAKLHEQVGDFMERYIEAEGFLYFPWIVPYVAVFTVLVVIYLPFFFRLSRTTRKSLSLSAFLFLLGAVIFDSLGGWEAYRNGTTTKLYSMLYTVEEVLEMTGLIVLIQTLMKELEKRGFTLVSDPLP